MDYEPKIGDLVTIRQWDDMAKDHGLNNDINTSSEINFIYRMRKYCGKNFRVIDKHQNVYFLENLDGWFSLDMFEKPKKQPDVPDWKFAMPINPTAFDLCAEKLEKLGKNDNNKAYTHFICFENNFPLDTGYNNFKKLTCKELTLSEFLSLPEPTPIESTPKISRIPDWVHDPRIMARRETGIIGWVNTSFSKFSSCGFFVCGENNNSFEYIAPLDGELIGTYDEKQGQLYYKDFFRKEKELKQPTNNLKPVAEKFYFWFRRLDIVEFPNHVPKYYADYKPMEGVDHSYRIIANGETVGLTIGELYQLGKDNRLWE